MQENWDRAHHEETRNSEKLVHGGKLYKRGLTWFEVKRGLLGKRGL
jgi:hypothetical protein